MVNVIRLRYVLFAGSPGEPRCSQFVVRLEALLSLVVCAGVSSLRCCSLFFCPLSALVRESPVRCSRCDLILLSLCPFFTRLCTLLLALCGDKGAVIILKKERKKTDNPREGWVIILGDRKKAVEHFISALRRVSLVAGLLRRVGACKCGESAPYVRGASLCGAGQGQQVKSRSALTRPALHRARSRRG